MEDQSRGTRNIINEFLMMPGSRDVYCSQDSIDFDKILSEGEVTVCNYDLASGDTNASLSGCFSYYLLIMPFYLGPAPNRHAHRTFFMSMSCPY